MASLPLSTIVVEKFLEKLERESNDTRPGAIPPGTILSRVMVQNSILRQYEVKVEGPDNESTLAWSLGLGPLTMPKRFFYGITLQEVFRLARKNL